MDCVFCKIIGKELPSYVIHEDDDFLAILDINPASVGHTLIISKKHEEDIFALDEITASKALIVAKQVANKLKAALNYDGLNILQNNSPVAGQTVLHFHIHLIPRYINDGIELRPPIGSVDAEELLKLRDEILRGE